MFTIPSIQKILVLVGILAAVWYGFKYLGQLKEKREAEAREGRNRPAKKNAWAARQEKTMDAEEMVQCSVCGTYVAAQGVSSCGKAGCPY